MRLSRLVTTALLTTLLATAFCGATRAADADLVIVHARVFDGRSEKLRDDAAVVISQSKIVAVVDSAVAPAARERIDAGGRVLLPGLIDAHVHPTIAIAISSLRDTDPNYLAARAAVEARGILLRGFTTIRDMGGPSFGLKQAIDEGLTDGPRIFPSGAIISQTSGHGDLRNRTAES